jgi:hypothetical protein
MWKRFVHRSPWFIILLVACQFSRVGAPSSPSPEPALQTKISGQDFSGLELFSSASIIETKEYVVQERFVLINEGPGQPDKQNLWVALIGDIYPYQTVSSMTITPENYRVFRDEYGNRIAEFDFSEMPAGTEIRVQIDYRVSVNRLAYDLSNAKVKSRFTSG